MMEKLYEKKRNKIITIILTMCCGVIFSCKTHHDNLFQEKDYSTDLRNGREPSNTPYITSGRYKNIYLVDTIKIENAVIFTTMGGYKVMTSDNVFRQLKSYDDDVLKRDDVFLWSPFGFGIDPIEIQKFSDSGFDNSHLKSVSIENTPQNIHARRFQGVYVSRLFLMTRKFYNDWFTVIDCCPMITDGDDHLFIKVLIN